MDTVLQDLRYAVRTLAKSPAFTAVAVLTLALGIGANTAIFSAVNGVLLKPLPYPGSDRLVQIMSTGFRGVRFGVSFPDLHDLRALSQDFTGVAAVRTRRHSLTGAGDPRDVQVAAVTANLLDVLQLRPEIGHSFAPAEERTPLALLSHGLWVTSFGRVPGSLGRSISLGGRSCTVVGVMPAGFQFPNEDVQVWTPMGEFLTQNPQAETDRGVHFLNAVARLAPGVSMERVVGDVKLLAARLSASDSGSSGGGRQLSVTGQASAGGGAPSAGGRSILDTGFDVTLLRDVAIGDVRRPLLILLSAVGLVLLIACANGANLLLARASARRREMAVRHALGAGRGRLVRQLLTESTLLALAAGVVGVALAASGLDALLAVWPHALPRTTEIGLDGAVLAFNLGLAVVTGVAFGLLPAWRASAPGIEQSLREDAPGATGGRRRLQSTLVVGEVTFALVLPVGAGLLVRSFIRLSNVDPGFDTRDVLAARIRLTPGRYPGGAQQTLFFDNMLTALQAHPGVQSASLAGTLPLSGNMFMIAFDPRTVRPDYPEPIMVLRLSVTSPDYFTTFRIPLRRGRGFTAQDRAGSPPVAVINRATADQLWPGQDPIGRQLTIGGPRQTTGPRPITIVGLIDNLRSASLDARPQPEIYRPASQQSEVREMWVALRAGNGRPLQLVGAIRDAVHQADPEQSIGEVVSLEQLIGRQTAARRFNTTLLTIFALLAVGLALVGIYGVTAYAVTQRTRELGIRMALGARGADVVRLLMRESLRRVAVGVGLGLLAALGVTRARSGMLFEVAPGGAARVAAAARLLVGVARLETRGPA